MATGIFPTIGVAASQTLNAEQNPLLAEGCTALFYALKCNPRLDVPSANAMISEVLNFVKCAGIEYDCSRLDNMCRAIDELIPEGCCPIVTPGSIV